MAFTSLLLFYTSVEGSGDARFGFFLKAKLGDDMFSSILAMLEVELKQRMRLTRVRLRQLWNVAEQLLLVATAQNLKRPVKFLAHRQAMVALSSA